MFEDEKAFEELFRANYAKLCGFAMTFLKDKDKAEEVVQDFFCAIWDKRAQLEVENVKAYLMTSIRNKCLNTMRKVGKTQEIDQKVSEEASELPIETFDLKARIKQAYEELPKQCAVIFKLSREEGMKYIEIAEQMNLSVKTVESQIGKALKLMRLHLKEYLPFVIIIIKTMLNNGY